MRNAFFVCRMVFIRHGNSEYTDAYPDLTPEGERVLIESGKLIEKQIAGWSGDVQIITSPNVRAIASANIVKTFLNGTCDSCIEVDRRIRAMDVVDHKKVKEFFKKLPKEYRELKNGVRGIDRGYVLDMFWERGDMFERRSEVQKRFMWYLGDVVRSFNKQQEILPRCIIQVSHLEVLWSLFDEFYTPDYEKDKPFSYGEFFLLDFYRTERPDLFSVKTQFRGKKSSGTFNTFLRKN